MITADRLGQKLDQFSLRALRYLRVSALKKPLTAEHAETTMF